MVAFSADGNEVDEADAGLTDEEDGPSHQYDSVLGIPITLNKDPVNGERLAVKNFEDYRFGLVVPASQNDDRFNEAINRNKHISEPDNLKKLAIKSNKMPKDLPERRKFFNING